MRKASFAVTGLALGAGLLSAACGPQSCPAALLSGQLLEANGTLVVRAPGGEMVAVDWSNYPLRREGEDLVVTDTWGRALAREDDVVNLGGGFVGSDGPFKVCVQVEVVPP